MADKSFLEIIGEVAREMQPVLQQMLMQQMYLKNAKERQQHYADIQDKLYTEQAERKRKTQQQYMNAQDKLYADQAERTRNLEMLKAIVDEVQKEPYARWKLLKMSGASPKRLRNVPGGTTKDTVPMLPAGGITPTGKTKLLSGQRTSTAQDIKEKSKRALLTRMVINKIRQKVAQGKKPGEEPLLTEKDMINFMQGFGRKAAGKALESVPSSLEKQAERGLRQQDIDVEKYKAITDRGKEERLRNPPKSPEESMSDLEKLDEYLDTYNNQIDILMKRKDNIGGETLGDKTEAQKAKETQIDAQIKHYEEKKEWALREKERLLMGDKVLKLANDLKKAGFKRADILKNEELRKRIQAQGITPEHLLPYF